MSATNGLGAGGRRSGARRSVRAARIRCPSAAPLRWRRRSLAVRDAHPAWGARKIARCLKRDGQAVASAVHACIEILCRQRRVIMPPAENAPPSQASASRRKLPICCGRWTSRAGSSSPTATRCHPLTVIDDHSRYALCLKACANERRHTVQGASGSRPSAAMACRRPSSSITAHLGAILPGRAGPASACGCSSSASTVLHCQALSPAEPRQERALPSHARRMKCSRMRRFRSLAGGAAMPSTPGARSTISSGRTRRSNMNVPASRYRPSSRAMPERLARGRI